MLFFQTRQLDLGSNNISNLYEFRNLQLNNLEQLSLASNQVCYLVFSITKYFISIQLKTIEELIHLKQLTHLNHLFLKDNPLTSANNKRNGSREDLIRSDLRKFCFSWTLITDRDKNKPYTLKSNVLFICRIFVFFSFDNNH